jgi:hypothetical protein
MEDDLNNLVVGENLRSSDQSIHVLILLLSSTTSFPITLINHLNKLSCTPTIGTKEQDRSSACKMSSNFLNESVSLSRDDYSLQAYAIHDSIEHTPFSMRFTPVRESNGLRKHSYILPKAAWIDSLMGEQNSVTRQTVQ